MIEVKGKYNLAKIFSDKIDEAPMAYKSIDDILKFVGDTVEIIDVIKPIYNYKSK